MKFFLSSAKAYFIFIAGRELYDGFLADVSDRDFTINSIFNGVINIDSFLVTSRRLNSLSALSEQFICRQIMPTYKQCVKSQPGFADKTMKEDDQHYSLKRYYSYRRLCLDPEQNSLHFFSLLDKVIMLLIERIPELGEQNEKRSTKVYRTLLNYLTQITKKQLNRTEEQQKQLERTIHFLSRFALYLAYTSNGSPNKISFFFEKYVRSHDYLAPSGALEQNHIRRKEHSHYYLTFGFYSQQRIGFVYYLTYPVLQAIINRSNTYGDKLLVSATFIVSHIFKLYNNGFSWRNLEQTPELLENNRSPELREYMLSIIDFLKSTHITDIHCGLYNYKFPMKIAEEITYHSKMSDEISALFNFSSEETQQIKRYYMRLLETYTLQGEKEKIADQYVVAHIHHILGDTYMNEENYSKAVFEYHTSVSIIQVYLKRPGLSENEKLFHYFYFLQTSLKLGLANERRHTDNSAYMVYTQLVSALLELRERTKPDGPGFIAGLFGKDVLPKDPLFSNIRMVYQPLLAQLYCLEKTGIEGIRIEDINQTVRNFTTLQGKLISEDTDRLLEADFYRKLGDITYYKNFQQLPGSDKEKAAYEGCKHRAFYKNTYHGYSPCNACTYYKKSLFVLLQPFMDIKGIDWLTEGSSKPKAIDWNKDYFIFQFFGQLSLTDEFRKKLLKGNNEGLSQIASMLELRGTTLFSCSNMNDKLSTDFINNFLEFIKIYNEKNKEKIDENIEEKSLKDMVKDIVKYRSEESHLIKAILYYWCTAYCFNYAGNLNSAVRCYRQILVIIHSFMLVHRDKKEDWSKIKIRLIQEHLINRALISLYSHYENANILEIQEIKWRYSKQMFQRIALNKLSHIPDIEEFIYPLYMLKISVWEAVTKELSETVQKERSLQKKLRQLYNRERQLRNEMQIFYHSVFMDKYKTPGGLSVTVQNLSIKARSNKKLLLHLLDREKEILDFDSCYLPEQFYNHWFTLVATSKSRGIRVREIFEFLRIDSKTSNAYELIEFLLIDTLFCLTQILEIVVPLKTTTLFTNYFIAETHEELLRMNYLAEFIYFYYAYFDETCTVKHKQQISDRLKRFVSTRQKTPRIINEDKEGTSPSDSSSEKKSDK